MACTTTAGHGLSRVALVMSWITPTVANVKKIASRSRALPGAGRRLQKMPAV